MSKVPAAAPTTCSDEAVTQAPVFNPFDPAFRADPYPTYRALRELDPVHASPLGITVLTRYDDVVRMLRSPDVSRDVLRSATDFTELEREQLATRRVRSQSMLNLDPPDHTRMRSLVNKAFTPSAIERLRPRIVQLVDGILDVASERGELNVVDDLAFPVPFQVISDLLDMPTQRADELRNWAQALTLSLEPTASEHDMDVAASTFDLMSDYLTDVIEHRRQHMGGDVLSALITAEESGDRLSLDELIATVVLLYVAGHETTVNLIGNSVLALLAHPGERAKWRERGAALDNNASDELLRYDGPVQQTIRVPRVDMEFDGETIAAGSRVLTVLGAANRDGAMFEDPDRLWLDRPNANRHMGFAAGIHYCLGSSLAKAEVQIAVGSMVRRFNEWELVGEAQWRDRLTIRGVSQLTVKLS
jgi:cytochrome P450